MTTESFRCIDADWGIRDDAASRLVEFIGVAWPKEHLEENLKFIAESLGPNMDEQSRDDPPPLPSPQVLQGPPALV